MKKTKSLSHVIKKGSILRVKFSSLYRISGKSSILWVVFLTKTQKIQFFDSCSRNFNSLSHFFKKKKKFRSSSHAQKIQLFELRSKKVQFFESYKKKVQFFESFFWKRVQFFDFFWKKCHIKNGFDSLSHIQKKSSILWVMLQKEEGSILLVTLKTFNSLSYIQRRFNPLSHCWKKKKNKRVQFFESFFQTGSIISVSQHFCKKKNLWVMLKKWVQFCKSCQKKGFNSVSYIQKINSWSHFLLFFKTFFESFFFAKKVQFSES